MTSLSVVGATIVGGRGLVRRGFVYVYVYCSPKEFRVDRASAKGVQDMSRQKGRPTVRLLTCEESVESLVPGPGTVRLPVVPTPGTIPSTYQCLYLVQVRTVPGTRSSLTEAQRFSLYRVAQSCPCSNKVPCDEFSRSNY